MRRAAKIDRNQPEIVAALRAIGCRVEALSQHGLGVPDLLVGTPAKPWHAAKRLLLLEVKDGDRPPSERKLTPAQEDWHREWAGYPVYVVESIDQALELVK